MIEKIVTRSQRLKDLKIISVVEAEFCNSDHPASWVKSLVDSADWRVETVEVPLWGSVYKETNTYYQNKKVHPTDYLVLMKNRGVVLFTEDEYNTYWNSL